MRTPSILPTNNERPPPPPPQTTTRTLALAAATILVMRSAGRTPPIRNSNEGKTLPHSIAEAKYLSINGSSNEWVLIRGHDYQANPLLVMLHGGPGISETVLWRYYNSILEKGFTVVYWDQRASGKSYDSKQCVASNNKDSATMTVLQFIKDLDAVVNAVCARCHKEQVILFGHSWGSVLGPLYAQAHPTKVAAYVGCGQLGNWAKSEELTYQYTLQQAQKQNNRKAIRRLQAIGPPPHHHDCANSLCTQRQLLQEVDGDATIGFLCRMLHMLYAVPETSVWDALAFWKILRYSIDAMWTEVTSINLIKAVPSLAMPTLFLLGRQDHCVFPEISLEFVDNLQAPSKEVIWFEESKHEPFMDEPDKFNKVMVEVVKPIVMKKGENT